MTRELRLDARVNHHLLSVKSVNELESYSLSLGWAKDYKVLGKCCTAKEFTSKAFFSKVLLDILLIDSYCLPSISGCTGQTLI